MILLISRYRTYRIVGTNALVPQLVRYRTVPTYQPKLRLHNTYSEVTLFTVGMILVGIVPYLPKLNIFTGIRTVPCIPTEQNTCRYRRYYALKLSSLKIYFQNILILRTQVGTYLPTSVSEPDPYPDLGGSVFKSPPGSGSVFDIRIRFKQVKFS